MEFRFPTDRYKLFRGHQFQNNGYGVLSLHSNLTIQEKYNYFIIFRSSDVYAKALSTASFLRTVRQTPPPLDEAHYVMTTFTQMNPFQE